MDTMLHRWVDFVTREVDGVEYSASPNQVIDLVEMRAWDYFLNPPILTSAIPEPSDVAGQPPGSGNGIVRPGEPQVVFRSVNLVRSFVERNGPLGVTEEVPLSTPSGPQVVQRISFNVWRARMITDEAFPGVLTEVGASIIHRPLHLFRTTAAHEARHAWQHTLLDISGNNSDDDCLPLAAFLNGTDIGTGTGSAIEIIDSPSNPEYPSFLGDSVVDNCDPGSSANQAIERDAVRFSRVLDALPAD